MHEAFHEVKIFHSIDGMEGVWGKDMTPPTLIGPTPQVKEANCMPPKK